MRSTGWSNVPDDVIAKETATGFLYLVGHDDRSKVWIMNILIY